MAPDQASPFGHWSDGLTRYEMFLMVVGFEVEAMADGLDRSVRAPSHRDYEAALVHFRLLVEFFTGPLGDRQKRRPTDMAPSELVPSWPDRGVPVTSAHLEHPVDLTLMRNGARTLNKWLMHLTHDRLDPSEQVVAFAAGHQACQLLALSADFELAIREGGIHPDPLLLRSHNLSAFRRLQRCEPRLVEVVFAQEPSSLGLE